jgi:dephospho-CoA kinase
VAIRLFGLTGGVASGKSSVAARFRAQGLAVIDADQLAREVVAPGSEGLAEVVAAFGSGVLAADGTLDRRALRGVVFSDAAARARLNAILHPRIAAETRARAAALEAQGVALACYEAALLVENGLADAFRPLCVVTLPPELQRRRLMARDGVSAEDADKIIAAQMPLAAKVALADHVLDNRGSLAELQARADEVLAAIRATTAQSPGVQAPASEASAGEVSAGEVSAGEVPAAEISKGEGDP